MAKVKNKSTKKAFVQIRGIVKAMVKGNIKQKPNKRTFNHR
jgi:hypothetical protein